MPTYQIGRLGRVYAKAESSYNTAPTLAATDALRHLDVRLNVNPRNRVNSPERHAHPSQIYRFTRRKTADWMVRGILYPSGTLNTLPDADPILANVFGASSSTNVTLSTTVNGSPTTTSVPCVAVTGLAVGDAVLINATNGGRQVRWITNIVSTTLTVAPALASAPTVGDSVKGCITYKLKTAIGSSLDIAHYLPNVSYEMTGCAPELLRLSFDANDEIMFEASGPAASRARPAQTDPATFTVAGSTPPSGLTGFARFNGAAEEFLKAQFEIKNGISLDNRAFGTSVAQAMFRERKREVTFSYDTMQSDDVSLLDLAEATTDHTAIMQCGLTEGSIIAVYAPVCELEVPDDQDSDEARQHSFKGVCKGTAGNDELYLAFA